MGEAGGHKFPGVVAVGPPDDHDDIAFAGQFDGGLLAILGGLADGVAEPDLGGGEPGAQAGDETVDPGDGLGGLADHPEEGSFAEGIDLVLREDDIASRMIFGEAADLDMSGLSDDDGVTALADQAVEGGMGAVDERAGGLGDLEAAIVEVGEAASGGAVRGDEDPLGRDVRRIVTGEDSVLSEFLEDGGVVDEFAEGGDGARGGFGAGELEGVANAEAPAEVGGAMNVHELCITK